MKNLRRKILVVEDEAAIRYLLEQNLEYEGFEVIVAEDGEAGLKLVETENPDLVLLDLMLPKISGMEVCKRLRTTGNQVPIIMLTARGQQIDKVVGLKAGADDYVTKPFDIVELTARIEAILRRMGKTRDFDQAYVLRDLQIDFSGNVIRGPGGEQEMTKIESQLLRYLIHHEGKILSRENIMEDVWGHDYLLSTRTIDTHVTHLRKKIEINPSDPQHIITVHRVGYKFVKG